MCRLAGLDVFSLGNRPVDGPLEAPVSRPLQVGDCWGDDWHRTRRSLADNRRQRVVGRNADCRHCPRAPLSDGLFGTARPGGERETAGPAARRIRPVPRRQPGRPSGAPRLAAFTESGSWPPWTSASVSVARSGSRTDRRSRRLTRRRGPAEPPTPRVLRSRFRRQRHRRRRLQYSVTRRQQPTVTVISRGRRASAKASGRLRVRRRGGRGPRRTPGGRRRSGGPISPITAPAATRAATQHGDSQPDVATIHRASCSSLALTSASYALRACSRRLSLDWPPYSTSRNASVSASTGALGRPLSIAARDTSPGVRVRQCPGTTCRRTHARCPGATEEQTRRRPTSQ